MCTVHVDERYCLVWIRREEWNLLLNLNCQYVLSAKEIDNVRAVWTPLGSSKETLPRASRDEKNIFLWSNQSKYLIKMFWLTGMNHINISFLDDDSCAQFVFNHWSATVRWQMWLFSATVGKTFNRATGGTKNINSFNSSFGNSQTLTRESAEAGQVKSQMEAIEDNPN